MHAPGRNLHNANDLEIVGRDILNEAQRAHRDAAGAVESWVAATRRAQWRSIRDVRETYPHADGVRLDSGTVVTVFNIRGNRYRLLTTISCASQSVAVEMFLTHAEYNAERWKRQI